MAVAPALAGSIPLQLVKAEPATGMGAMQGVTYIQRLNTKGGVAPAAACDAGNAGQRSRSPTRPTTSSTAAEPSAAPAGR